MVKKASVKKSKKLPQQWIVVLGPQEMFAGARSRAIPGVYRSKTAAEKAIALVHRAYASNIVRVPRRLRGTKKS